MTSEELIKQTQEQIQLLNRKGRRLPYPEFVKDAVIELSKHMTASSIAEALGTSKTFACKIARFAKVQKRSVHKHKTNQPLSEKNNVSNIQLVEITDQLKSVVKDDATTALNCNKDLSSNLAPTMRLTTNSGIIVEIFS